MAETMLGAKAIREAVGEAPEGAPVPRKKVLSNCFMHRTSQAFDKYDPADCLVRMLRWYTAQGSNMALSLSV